jgi:acetyl-CoA C-acetyltransferase
VSAARDRGVVLIGVGQLRNNRERVPEQALEPLDLIERAADGAAADAGLDRAALAEVDAVGVVQIVSWTYEDAAAAVASRIGAGAVRGKVSEAGGHQPVAVLAELAAAIAAGESEMALLCGGEAQSSVELLGAVKEPEAAAGWSHEPGGVGKFSRAVGGTERMWDLGLVGPIRVYPLFENRLRADLGLSFAESQDWSARMYARFSEIAAGNEAAWNQEPVSAAEVATVDARNRMICWPYPLRMNAYNRVDQAGAVLLASVAAADRLGIPEERRVHLHATAVAADSEDVLERESYGRSPGLEATLDAALAGAGATAEDLDLVDLYSCFPIVPKLGAIHLGRREDLELSVTGGLTSFGGAHNDYSMHALVAAVRGIRAGAERGLVYANGEYLTRHAAAVLGGEAGAGAFSAASVDGGETAPRIDDELVGEVEVETFTVEFDREAKPARGYVIVRGQGGARSGVRVSKSDTATLAALVSETDEPIGRTGRVVREGERRLFTFGAA